MQTVRTWLENWRGVGDVVTGMTRQGYMLNLSNVDASTWRATFSSAPMLSADGFGTGPTPWRGVQLAAWEEALRPRSQAHRAEPLRRSEDNLMATVIKRTWLSKGPTGHKVRKIAYGYTLQVDGKQERHFDAGWTKNDARNALAARVLERDTPRAPAAPKTLGETAEKYLAFKRAEGKRSIGDDTTMLGRLTAWFGADTAITDVTAQRIADYSRERATQQSRLKRTVSPATRNRELAVLRHLLRLAEEWGVHRESAADPTR